VIKEMYVRFGKNKVPFKTPKDLKNKREIGIYKIRDDERGVLWAIIRYVRKGDKGGIPRGVIRVRLPAIAKNYADDAFGIGGR